MLRVLLPMALENADTSLLQLLTVALGKDGFHFLSCSWLMFIYQGLFLSVELYSSRSLMLTLLRYENFKNL